MFNQTHTKEMEKKAWKIISDPKAKEDKWQAACKIVEGKSFDVTKIPKPVGLVLSLAVSIVGSIGGYFTFLCLLGSFIIMTNNFYSDPFYIGLAMSAPFTLLYFFTSIFTYQKHKWKGGKAWDIIGCAPLVILLAPMVLGLVLSIFSMELLGALILATMILSLVLAYKVSKAVAEKSIKNLSSSIGSTKILDYTKYGLCAGLLIPFIGRFVASGPEAAIIANFVLVCGLMATTSYLAVRKLKITSRKTSHEVSTFIWSPILVTALTFPPMAILSTILYGGIFDINQISALLLTLFGGLATIALIYSYPIIGANIAHWQMSKELRADLTRVPLGLDNPLPLDKTELPSVSGSSLPKGETA